MDSRTIHREKVVKVQRIIPSREKGTSVAGRDTGQGPVVDTRREERLREVGQEVRWIETYTDNIFKISDPQ